MSQKVSIVIPCWNGREYLDKNLIEILKVKGVDEVIIVDDASTDGSADFIEKSFPEIKLIKKEKNSGFSTTVNIGFKEALGEIIFLLNQDAKPNNDCLAKALVHFKDPEVFSVGCNVGGVWSWGVFKDGYFWHKQAEKNEDSFNKAHETLWASGGSGIFRKSIWESLRGLDELFNPFYEEDVDIGYRAWKKGYKNIWEPKAIVEHYKVKGVIESSFEKSRVFRVAQRNQLFFIWKNITDDKMICEHLLYLLKNLVFHPGYWLIFLSALRYIGGILSKRGVEKRFCKRGDIEILNKYFV